MLFDKAYSLLLQKFERELPVHLTYHDVQHTRAVVNAVQHIGESEKVTLYELDLLNTAALYHDAGFLKIYNNHEEASCLIAKEDLPQFGYSADDIDTICDLIMATKVPQNPTNQLQQILCDADLYYFGSDKYFEIAERLYHEFKHEGIVKNRADWKKVQINFLDSHRFFSPTVIAERGAQKIINLEMLKKIPRRCHTKTKNFLQVLAIWCTLYSVSSSPVLP